MSTFLKDFRHGRSARPARCATAALLLSVLVAACAGGEGAGPSPAPTVAQVLVQPAQHALVAGQTATYIARALDAQGVEVSGRAVEWTSTDPAIASVSVVGLVTALTPGTTTIRATVDGKTGAAALEVTQVPVAAVVLDLATVQLVPGDTRTLVATATSATGAVLPGRIVTWATGDAAVATIDGAGRVTAVAVGETQVSATIEGRIAHAAVSVRPAPVATVTISPTPLVLEVGERQQLTAVAKDARGTILQGRVAQWSVDNATAVTTPTGLVTGMRHGYATITATVEGVSVSIGGTIIEPTPTDHDLVYYRQSVNGSAELFVLPLDGIADPVRINAGTVSRTPTASPDGKRIAFAVVMEELGTGTRVDDIFAVDRTGLHMKRLTSLDGFDDLPDWSPVGNRIAWHHWERGGRSDIWVMAADGSAQVNLTGDMSANGFRSAPSWSRDGQRIAFSQSESGPGGTTASIWTMRADGSDKRQVTSTTTGFDSSPTWSPDGQRLAFLRYYGAEADITIIDVTTLVSTRLPVLGLESGPSWSPDGTLIAFSLGGRGDLYTLRPDGTGLRLRTVNAAWGGGLAPQWIKR
ncbi:MAG: PD40 domain-containing protein [Gemmatimonadaceae bacterium]|nr:PD40 domain-containing protein [Gemmatimonadaceae bacterium]